MKLPFILLILAFIGGPVWARDSRPSFYDEVYDQNGHLRAPYKNVYPELSKKSKTEKRRFYSQSKNAYSGDNALHDIPLMMSPEEYDSILVPGVQQRVRALLSFLADEYSGVRSYQRILDPKIVDRIRERNGETAYRGLISPDRISYFYGPDIMRGPRGDYVVLEDNGGAVGLAFDLRLAHQTMLNANSAVLSPMHPRDPDEFYRQLAEEYKAEAARKGGKAVLLVSPLRTDGEDKRIRDIFSDHGIEVVYPSARDVRLEIRADGVYTISKKRGEASRERVGFVILAGEPAWYDVSQPAARERAIIEEAHDLLSQKGLAAKWKEPLLFLLSQEYSQENMERIADVLNRYNPLLLGHKSYRGLIQAILDGRVSTNITPGTEFISDKEFYLHVEDLIRFYLNEEPILHNLRTWNFSNGSGKLIKASLDRCFNNFSHYVLKKVDGRGGDGVWVGPRTEKSLIPQLKAMVEKSPDEWQFQEYISPSRVGDLIIDQRALAQAKIQNGKTSAIVSNVPASRGNLWNGNGKVNLSGDGRALTVLIPCEKYLDR